MTAQEALELAAQLAEQWGVVIMQCDAMTKEEAQEIANSVGPNIAQAIRELKEKTK